MKLGRFSARGAVLRDIVVGMKHLLAIRIAAAFLGLILGGLIVFGAVATWGILDHLWLLWAFPLACAVIAALLGDHAIGALKRLAGFPDED